MNEVVEKGPPCVPDAVISVVGVTSSAGGLTVSVAVRVWVPWPVSTLVKVIVALSEAVRLLALVTVNVTVVPEDAVPELGEALSQLGSPEIE